MDRKIGIMSAMQEEIDGVEALMHNGELLTIGSRKYYQGKIKGVPAVLVFSGWGKVAAAATISTLIHRFGITELIFTGVAGALRDDIRIGDIVVGEKFVQHDMDARPIFDRFEIPLMGLSFIPADGAFVSKAINVIGSIIESGSLNQLVGKENIELFELHAPRLIAGDIASGDQFINNSGQRDAITSMVPSVCCVEMEGAAVAQVCYENQIPFLIIRIISDVADESSHIDFISFVRAVSSKYAIEMIRNLVK